MRSIYKLLYIPILFFILIGCKEKNTAASNQDDTKKVTSTSTRSKKGLFEKISVDQSNIDFSNDITENLATIENLFDFDYFYNGAGVGIDDINNDGLPDIFFTGNQVPNKLYLNKGNFVFEDISETAGINKGKVWSNGVTFVDINADGYLDIYVSQGGPKRAENRANLLFVNNQDNTFTEQAKTYGIDNSGISTQSVFFDYDKDGDLDCFVSNENEFYGLDPVTFYNQMNVKKESLDKSSGQLYRNDGGSYTNVTESAGVLSASFGLGVSVSDINNDGWPDIYVSNDYYVPDALYINNKNGTFSNEIKTHTNQVSFFGMGVDVADINNDALQDIFVLDMAASDHVRSKTLMASMDTKRFSLLVDRFDMPYQYMFNSLQLNAGNNTFHNVSQLSKVAKTDWSWAGLLVDFDLDGLKDIYVTNGYRRYALDNDSQKLVRQAQQLYQGNVPLEVKERLYQSLPSEKLSNILYNNTSDLHFKNETATWGFLEPSFSNGASYADLDNDGDLDLVVNNMDAKAFVYKNTSIEKGLGNYLKVNTNGRTSEPFAKVTIQYDGKQQMIETKRVKGYLSSTPTQAYFGVGDATQIDTVRVQWSSGKTEVAYDVKINSTLTFDEVNAGNLQIEATEIQPFFAKGQNYGLAFNHRENNYDDFEKEILLPYKQSTLGPFITKGDVNDDGLDDIFVGGAAGQAGQLWLQTETGFQKIINPALEADRSHEDMEALFFDADGDGDQDLYVVSGGNEFEANSKQYNDRLYKNDGTGRFAKQKEATLSSLAESGKSVTAIDFDKDGDLDLIVGNRIIPQQYPMPAVSYILENKEGAFSQSTSKVAPSLTSFGMVNKVITTDFNSDGWDDFIAVGEWGAIGMFQNNEGKFENVSESKGLHVEKGLWFTIAETDVNNDGQPDYLVGNMGKNIKFNASKSTPFKIFGNDFDKNGTYDIVLSNQYLGREVPLRGRECSSQQMPFITDKFETYNEFANASLHDIYGDALYEAYQGEVTTLSSMLLLNTGSGNFEVQLLPSAVQTFPLLSASFTDVNNDGFQDAVVLGNIYNTEVETPRLDMGTGTVLLGGVNGYSVANSTTAGLFVNGNAKSAVIVKKGTKNLLVCATNNGPLQIYEQN